jgi:dihydrofolate reductase
MINLIACCDLRNGLGYQNQLLTKLPNDMKHFKELTSGHFVVMGHNTFRSIGKRLPDRQNIVLTHKTNCDLPNDVYVYHSVENVIHEYENYGNKEVEMWIIGGEQIYKQFLKYADKIHLTIIEHQFSKVDTFFPQFSFLDWKVSENIKNEADQDNPYVHHFVTYERRKYIGNKSI